MADTGDDTHVAGEVTTAVVIAVVTLATIALGAVVALTLADKPVDNVILILTVLLVPAVTQLLQSRKLDKTRRTLADVHTKVNGRLDGLLSDRAILEEQVRQLGGTPVTLPTPRVTTETALDTTSQNRGES